MKSFVPKQTPICIKYRNYKNYSNSTFRLIIQNVLSVGEDISYDTYESIFLTEFNKLAPIKEKYVRANNAPYMNKTLSKAIMNRSRLRNKFLKNPNDENRAIYKKTTQLLC